MASVSAISTAEAQVPPAARSISEIFGCNIDVTTWTAALGTLLAQARARAPGYACICNVHSVVTASGHAPLREAINAATPVPEGNRSRSIPLICWRRGMMTAAPRTAPATQASVISQKSTLSRRTACRSYGCCAGVASPIRNASTARI